MWTPCRRLVSTTPILALAAALLIAPPASAQTTPEYRGFWAETFNAKLGTRADVDRVVGVLVPHDRRR